MKSTTKHQLKVNGQETLIRIGKAGEHRYQAKYNGVNREIFAHRINSHHIYVEVEGQGVHLHISPKGEAKQILINGITYHVEKDKGLQRKKGQGNEVSRPDKVTPPIPGSVTKILVQEGEEVTQNQALVVLSAMKMEMTVHAPQPATVKEVCVTEGEQVTVDRELITFC